jgi:glucose/arabinose dehydrogenase
MLGDDQPPDELNRVAVRGQNFGYPYCHGGTTRDPEFGAKHACSEFVAPAQNLGPHVAALGMRFYTGTQFPAEYRNQVFIAEHGSWNRSRKIGTGDARAPRRAGNGGEARALAEAGYGGARGVPTSSSPDGSQLVSDDTAGAIYRIGTCRVSAKRYPPAARRPGRRV